MVDCIHIWKTSNLYHKSSVAWLTVPIWWTSNLHCKTSVVCLMAQSNTLQRHFLRRISLFSIICSEPNAIICGIFKIKHRFHHARVHHTDLSLVRGSLRLTPTTLRVIEKVTVKLPIVLSQKIHELLLSLDTTHRKFYFFMWKYFIWVVLINFHGWTGSKKLCYK